MMQLASVSLAMCRCGASGPKMNSPTLLWFLASEAAAYITGSIYHCDGGLSLTRTGSWMAPE